MVVEGAPLDELISGAKSIVGPVDKVLHGAEATGGKVWVEGLRDQLSHSIGLRLPQSALDRSLLVPHGDVGGSAGEPLYLVRQLPAVDL